MGVTVSATPVQNIAVDSMHWLIVWHDVRLNPGKCLATFQS
jgi:hypothetical protein